VCVCANESERIKGESEMSNLCVANESEGIKGEGESKSERVIFFFSNRQSVPWRVVRRFRVQMRDLQYFSNSFSLFPPLAPTTRGGHAQWT
jgi:hypothetical protein